jgi:hypothetical protein
VLTFCCEIANWIVLVLGICYLELSPQATVERFV